MRRIFAAWPRLWDSDGRAEQLRMAPKITNSAREVLIGIVD